MNGRELDWVIVRENSEGEYAGVGGRVHRGSPLEVATDVSMFTRAGVERIMRFAFALARSRPRKLLTVVTKSNAQRHAMVMWDEIAAEVAREFPDVTWDKMLVDAMTMRMVTKPQIARHDRRHQPARRHPVRSRGGAGRLARASRRPPISIRSATFPSMFEPIHGSAFDIMGKGIANPIGTFWSAVMMLEHLGEKAAAARLMQAIERVTADPRFHTPDLGGKRDDGRRDGSGDRRDTRRQRLRRATREAPHRKSYPRPAILPYDPATALHGGTGIATGAFQGGAGGPVSMAPEVKNSAIPEGSTRGREVSAGCCSAACPSGGFSRKQRPRRKEELDELGVVRAARGAEAAPQHNRSRCFSSAPLPPHPEEEQEQRLMPRREPKGEPRSIGPPLRPSGRKAARRSSAFPLPVWGGVGEVSFRSTCFRGPSPQTLSPRGGEVSRVNRRAHFAFRRL